MEYENLIIKYKEWECNIYARQFAEGRKKKLWRLDLNDIRTGEPIATLNKYLDSLSNYQIALDSKNYDLENGIRVNRILASYNIIEAEPLGVISSGFNDYPVYKLHPDYIKYLTKH